MICPEKIKKPPLGQNDSPENKLLDYFELLCCCSNSLEIGLNDFVTSDSLGAESEEIEEVAGLEETLYDELDEESEYIEIHDENYSDEEREIATRELFEFLKKEELTSRMDDKVEFICSLVDRRIDLLDEFYPFEFDSETRVVKMKSTDDLDWKRKIYLVLLAASNTSYSSIYNTGEADSIDLPLYFEAICTLSLRELLGKNFDVFRFGAKNFSSEIDGAFFNVNKFADRVGVLSTDCLKIDVGNLEEEDNSQNTGDGGLDIVGWHKTDDNLAPRIMYFCQCSSGYAWSGKQLECTLEEGWGRRMSFRNTPAYILFTSSSYRHHEPTWYKKCSIKMTALFDRERIIANFKESSGDVVADVLAPLDTAINQMISLDLEF